MADYITTNIRNIALIGHGSEGKTTLTEAMLYAAGLVDRQGRVEDGTTMTDFDPEETRRKCSISAATAPVDWNGKIINVVDVPGYFDFVGEMIGPLRVVETAVIVVDAVGGLSVGAEKAWDYAGAHGLGRMFIINQMDRDHADFDKISSQLRAKYGNCVVPILLPLGKGPTFRGVVNVLDRKAYEGAYKKSVEVPMPENMKGQLMECYSYLIEQAAAADEELMEKYFETGELTFEEIKAGFRKGMKDGSIVPVVAVSAATGVGIARMLDLMAKYFPSPAHNGLYWAGKDPRTGEDITRICKDDQPFSAFVYKTIADPFVGKLSLFRIFSGMLSGQTTLYNPGKDKTEKCGGIYILRGKKQVVKESLHAGDIGAMAKLQYTSTGDTLCDPANPVIYPPIEYPKPCISKAVYAAKQGEEDKVFSGLQRLMEEDPSVTLSKDPETMETLLSGQGEMHLDVIRSKLASKFGANCVLKDPKIPYRETIRKTVKVQGRHKKQTGGHGQFGDVWIQFEPIPGEDVEFAENVFGGSVPKNFFPAVEKGVRQAAQHGVLAGYPMVGLKATLLDGSYHPVDSSEMAFIMAAKLSYKAAIPEAGPVLLEPIGTLKAHVPADNTGDIMGEVTKRRGRVLGMEPDEDGMQTIIAEVPLAELANFTTFIRQITQGRGWFTTEFARYEILPEMLVPAVVEQAKKLGNLDESADD